MEREDATVSKVGITRMQRQRDKTGALETLTHHSHHGSVLMRQRQVRPQSQPAYLSAVHFSMEQGLWGTHSSPNLLVVLLSSRGYHRWHHYTNRSILRRSPRHIHFN